MAAIAIAALRRQDRWPWRRDGAVLVLCLTGCAIAAFIPPGYFEGTAVTRHMLGMNLASVLPIPVAVALAISLLRQALLHRQAPGHQARDPRAAGREPGLMAVPFASQAGVPARRSGQEGA